MARRLRSSIYSGPARRSSKSEGGSQFVGIELCFQFSYEENIRFPSEDQEEFGVTRHYFFIPSSTIFTDSFTDTSIAVRQQWV